MLYQAFLPRYLGFSPQDEKPPSRDISSTNRIGDSSKDCALSARAPKVRAGRGGDPPSMDDGASAAVVEQATELRTRRHSPSTADVPTPTGTTANAISQSRNVSAEPAAAATADANTPRT